VKTCSAIFASLIQRINKQEAKAEERS